MEWKWEMEERGKRRRSIIVKGMKGKERDIGNTIKKIVKEMGIEKEKEMEGGRNEEK